MISKNELIKKTIENLNINNLKNFNSFLELNENNIYISIEDFLINYFYTVNLLFKNDDTKSNQFLKWYQKEGKDKLIYIFNLKKYSNINVKKTIKILVHYNILMEQSITTEDADCLLNVLIDTPISIYLKFYDKYI